MFDYGVTAQFCVDPSQKGGVVIRPHFKQTRPEEAFRINHRIRVPEVRVIDEDGEQLGIMSTYDAIRKAEEKGLELVEVSPKASPPVCKIMDYGKFKYERAKQEKIKRANATQISMKEVKFRPKTDDHDLDFKIRNIRKFLEDGDKIRVVVSFRGREIVHPEFGFQLLETILKQLGDAAEVEQKPAHEGRAVSMLLSPPANRKIKKPEVRSEEEPKA